MLEYDDGENVRRLVEVWMNIIIWWLTSIQEHGYACIHTVVFLLI